MYKLQLCLLILFCMGFFCLMLMLWEICALPGLRALRPVQIADLKSHGLALPVALVPCIYFVLSVSVLSRVKD